MIFRRLILALSLGLAGAIVPPAAAHGPPAPQPRPITAAPTHVTAIWGGARSSIVLKSDGSVWDWGMNDYGKLGDNAISTFTDTFNYINGTQDHHLPIQVHGPNDVGFLDS